MVPSGWSEGQVLDFLFLQRGFDLTAKQAVEGSVPVYSSSGLAYFHNEAKVKGPGIVTGRKGSVGPVYLIHEDFWPHDTTLWVKDFKGNNVKYIEYFLIFLKLDRFDEASSVPTLNRNNVHGVKCLFPPLPEQKKIAQILSTWDKAITATEQLLANSQQQKKALMQQLLTGKKRLLDKNGVRFSGGWERMPLSDVAEVYQPKTISQAMLTDAGYPVYGANGIIGFYKEFNHEREQIAVTCRGSTCGVVNWTQAQSWITGNAMVINTDNIPFVCKKYLFYVLDGSNLTYLISGSGQPQITGSIKNHVVNISSMEEQQKIAAVLSLADQEISALQQKLDALKQEKKALMQQLLTGKRRVLIN